MSHIVKSAGQSVGNTPLMELVNIEKKYDLKARILAKLEFLNPSGSIKDRVAEALIDDAEERGLLKPGGTIIEPTSGNTGIGLCAIGVPRGYRVIIVMPDSMSMERRKIIQAYGGELVLTPAAENVNGAIAMAQKLHDEIEGSILAGQFINEANPRAHYNGTGREIWEDSDGQIDYFLAGVGTGGTLTGVGRFLKERKPDVRIIALEPECAAVLSGGKDGPHCIEGIGDGLIPDVLDTHIYDGIMLLNDERSLERSRELARLEGLLVGISSGGALDAAIRVAKMPEAEGKTICIILADSGCRYFSTKLFF